MSSSELPPPSGAQGKSVFSVFGFSGNRYGDKDFDSPLESAPESFDASNTLTNRRGSRKKSLEGVLPLSPETDNIHMDYQPPPKHSFFKIPRIPKSLLGIFSARKLRVNLPDNSKLALQSMGQSKPDTENKHHAHTSHSGTHSYVRRYSTPQGENEDAFDTQVIQKFKSSVSQSSRFILNRNNSKGNLYSSQGEGKKSSSSTNNLLQVYDSNMGMTPNMSRRQSTPDFSATSSLKTLKENQKLSTDASGASEPNSGLLSRYLGRRQSLDTLAVAKFTIGEEASGTSKSSSELTALSQSIQKPTQVDTTDSPSSNKSSFGILSKTRQFGAWLSKATDGEKVEVTKKDLNVLAPNSF